MSLISPSQRMWKEAGMRGKGMSPGGRAEVLISFSWLTQSQWRADGCTFNTTFFFFCPAGSIFWTGRKHAVLVFFSLQNVEVVKKHTKGKI